MKGFDRRRFLSLSGLTLLFSTFSRAAEGASFFMKRFFALSPREVPPFFTPNKDFYIVNYSRPREIVASAWHLQVTGRVANPLTLNYDQIRMLPSAEYAVTLECIDNEVAGDLISNALWKGVWLKTILEMAKPLSDAEDVVMYAADDYSDGIPLDRAMNGDVLLAYKMNSEDLPTVHGYPLRAVVPGLYGIKNVKWITRIDLVNIDYKGYWQQRGWTDQALIKVGSRIDAPGSYNTLRGGSYQIRGIAFSGAYGIHSVELSTDGGKSWVKAALEKPPSNYTWVFWRYDWKLPKPGSYEIIVRAEDKFGRKQSAFLARAFPEGTSGLHSVIAFTE